MIEAILKRGTLVSVITAMILLMGIVATLRVPIQMIPDLDVRIITVETGWPGATPQDVEKEILIEQEEYLRGLPNLKRLTSLASTGRAQIELEFPFGTDINEALLRVNNALSQVPSYPENVDEPVLRSNSFSYNAFLAFNVVPAEGNPKNININMMLDFVEDNVRPVLERVPGVSQVEIRGGAERQIQISTDAAKLAERGITLTDLRDAIRARNTDVSAGDIDSGKRRYLLRTVGRFETLEELENLIITRRGDAITRLSDVATVRLDHAELRNLSSTNGEGNIRLGLIRQTGSNVIAIKESILPMLDGMNEDILAPAGLRMYLSNDDVRYVEDSVSNVRQNILIGAGLALLVMFLFLRSPSATLIGMIGMPICTVAGFLGLLLFERTINVISLAGIAFAIGMTIDNTIVVLESIEQQRQKGKTRFEAARDGTRHVWSAVLSGTMTTVLVFLPLMFVKEEAGQLFSDIGIAISSSIVVSMVVAVALVPAAYANFAWRRGGKIEPPPPRRQFLLGPLFWLIGKPWRRLACLAVTVSATVAALVFLTPSAEYLPEGEEAKVFATMIAPPGYSLEEMDGIAKRLEAELLPALDYDPADFDSGKTTLPALSRVSVGVQPQSLRIISETKDPKHIDAFMDLLDARFREFPGMRAFSSRGSIISSNDGGTRAVALNISGPGLPEIYQTAQRVYQDAGQIIADARINSVPSSLTLGQPLLEMRPKWDRLAEMGFGAPDFGYAAAALTDGAFVDEFFLNDDKVDMFLFSRALHNQQLDRLGDLPVHSPRGGVVPLGSLVDIRETVDTAEIRRVDGRRTVSLYIIPPRSMPLETAVQKVREEVVAPLRRGGELPPGVSIDLTGASDQLDSTRSSLANNLWIAVVLCYLQLVIIYRHWGSPFLILATVPLGISGGIVGLWLLNFIGGKLPLLGIAPINQPFDMITMLGFLILLGVSVNNPILIVDRTMENRREGMETLDAVKDAIASRLRPVMMTTSTTLMGLSPLVLLPGAGTELYRGLGVIVLAGLACASVVTLTFLPALLMTVLPLADRFTAWGKRAGAAS